MTREEYLAQRKELMNNAEKFLNEGKNEDAEKTMKDVEQLDQAFENEAKQRANLEALMNDAGFKKIEKIADLNNGQTELAENSKQAYASKEYLNAWAKSMKGEELTQEEQKVYKMVNAYTHTTENTGIVIPETVTRGIFDEVSETYPFWEDCMKTNVKGVLSLIKADESSEAKWYTEDEEVEDATETFLKDSLNGCELARNTEVSWKLKEMAIDEFVPFIQKRLAEKMGKGLAYGATHGAGIVEGQKPEPLGVITALLKEDETPQIVTYESENLAWGDLTMARSKINSKYAKGIVIYANSATIWNEIASVTDANGRPLFIADTTKDGVGKIIGCTVKEDSSIEDGEILFSNAAEGYHANINKAMSVTTQENNKKRITDYCAYAIVDGSPRTTKAHALLKYDKKEILP